MSQSVRTYRSGPLQVTVCVDADLFALDRGRRGWLFDFIDGIEAAADTLPGAETSDRFPDDAPAEANPGPQADRQRFLTDDELADAAEPGAWWPSGHPVDRDTATLVNEGAIPAPPGWFEDTDPLGLADEAMFAAAADNSRALYEEARASVALDGETQSLDGSYIGQDEDEAPEDPADVLAPLTDEDRADGWIDGPEMAALVEDDPSLLSADLMRVTPSPSTFSVHAVKLPPEPTPVPLDESPVVRGRWDPTSTTCVCGRDFRSMRARAGHSHSCPVWQEHDAERERRLAARPPEPDAAYVCECGHGFKSAAGLAGHRRWCDTVQDAKPDPTARNPEPAAPEPDDDETVAKLQALISPPPAPEPEPDAPTVTPDPTDPAITEAVTEAWRRPPLLLTIEMRRLFRQAMECEDAEAVDDLVALWPNAQAGRFRRAFDIDNDQLIVDWIDRVREVWHRTPQRAAG